MSDPNQTVREKVAAIFCELVGDRATRLDGSVIAEPAMSTIAAAFVGECGHIKAADIGFHMADWNSDAAFVVAVHLFPERFTPEEVVEGVSLFLVHAPSHIRAACGLTGNYKWTDFASGSDGEDSGTRPT